MGRRGSDIEIGVLAHPSALTTAVHGLVELLETASRLSIEANGTKRPKLESGLRSVVMITSAAALSGLHAGKQLACRA